MYSIAIKARWTLTETLNYLDNAHRGINVDHGNNVDQHLKTRNKWKYSILYLYLLRGFEC